MLGTGTYTLREAARLIEMPATTVRAWFRGRTDRKGRGPVLTSDYPTIRGDFAVSFLDLIDALVACDFRREGVQMLVIRRAFDILQDELDTKHPFAHQSLYTDGRGIIRQTNEATLVDVVTRQQWFEQMRERLKRIDYQADTKLAGRWRISDGVLIDPQIAWGKPVAERTGISTRVLANQFRANGENAGLVADLFRVNEQDVLNAVSFEERYGAVAA